MKKTIVLVDNITAMNNRDSQTMIVDSSILFNFSQDEEYVAKSSRDFLNSIPLESIAGKDILEWFRYKDISLWWFAYRRIWPKVEECIRFTENFKKMLEELMPSVVVVQGFYDKIDLIRQICASRKIRVVLSMRSIGRKISHNMYNRALWRVGLYRFNKRIKRKQFKRIELAKAMSHHELDINLVKDPIIYLADGNYRKRVFDATKGKFVSGEHIVQGVIDNVKGSRNLLCIDVDYSYFSESLGLKKRLEDGAQYWIPFEILITDDIRRECKSGIESVTNSVGQLFRKKEFQKILTYEGIRLWSTLEVVFRTLVSDIYLPTYILSIESAKRLLLKIRPSTIFLPYETGIYAMAFIVAAEGLKIRTIGMQHGIIHKGHLDYSINNLKTSSSMGCPIPSLLLLFGEFYRKLLVETFSYPSNRVKVVGNPAYENVQDMACGVNKGEVLKFLGFDSSRRTVLVATSMHQAKYGREEYDVLIVESLVQSFAGMEDIQVVVKAHPAEDPSVYSNLVTSKGANNFRIIRDYPIQPLISICDVFVSVLSTTILEAMAMKKPVVIAQGSETIHRDLMSIGGSGAAVRASIKDISRIIIQILNNADFKNELIDRSSEIIKSHFNVPARGISMRIADIIIHNSDDENSRYYNSQFRF